MSRYFVVADAFLVSLEKSLQVVVCLILRPLAIWPVQLTGSTTIALCADLLCYII